MNVTYLTSAAKRMRLSNTLILTFKYWSKLVTTAINVSKRQDCPKNKTNRRNPWKLEIWLYPGALTYARLRKTWKPRAQDYIQRSTLTSSNCKEEESDKMSTRSPGDCASSAEAGTNYEKKSVLHTCRQVWNVERGITLHAAVYHWNAAVRRDQYIKLQKTHPQRENG